MSFSDNKFEIAIGGLGAVLFVGMAFLFKAPVQAVFGGHSQDVVYEMPRPKRSFLASLFDLGDREIDRKYVNPFAKKKNKEVPKAQAAVKPPAVVPASVKPSNKLAENKKTEQAPKKNVDIKVVGGDSNKAFSADDFWGDNGAQPNIQTANGRSGGGPGDGNERKNYLDGNQWRSLLMAQPTKENVQKLIEAFSRKELEEETYFAIVVDLYRNNKVEVQGLGLAAAKSIYSAKGFAVTAQYYDQLAPEVQTQAHSYLLSYGVAGRLPLLMTALQSPELEVVNTAAEVVLDGFKKARSGTTKNDDPRASRGDVMVNTVSAYAKFVPVLQKLKQSQDNAIASMAGNLLNELQSTVAAL